MEFQGVYEVLKNLRLFVLQDPVTQVELDYVREDGIEVGVKAKQDYLPEVCVVDVCHHVEEEFLNPSQDLVEIGRKLVPMLRWKECLVIDSFLVECE